MILMITVANENLIKSNTLGVKKSTALFITIKELPQIIAANTNNNEPLILLLTITPPIYLYILTFSTSFNNIYFKLIIISNFDSIFKI